MKLYGFMYRQRRSVTNTVKNTLGHFNVITVVKFIEYVLNKLLIYIKNIQYILV